MLREGEPAQDARDGYDNEKEVAEVAWFRVDDQFGTNPKVLSIPRSERQACLGAWLLAGVWSAQHLTDGRIPAFMLDELGTDVSQRDRLVTAGLWTLDGEDVVFNDWSDYQPSRSDVLARREAERRRKEEWRQRKAEKPGNKGQSPAGTDGGTDASVTDLSSLPDPTRPDPSRPTYIEEAKASSYEGKVRPEVETLVTLLNDLIEANGAKRPNVTKANTDAARLLIDKDGYTVEQVEYIIRWCQADEFWRSNILSMSKLRTKFDQLKLKALSQTRGTNRAQSAYTLAQQVEMEEQSMTGRGQINA